jgi:ribosomal protein S27AE
MRRNLNSLCASISDTYGSDVLPQRILCEKCGAVLYEGMELTPPDEIVQRYDGKCPKCGKKLSFNPINVEIKKMK